MGSSIHLSFGNVNCHSGNPPVIITGRSGPVQSLGPGVIGNSFGFENVIKGGRG